MARPRDSHAPNPPPGPQTIGCLAASVRLFWLVGGGAALAIVTLLIARAGTFSGLDVLYGGLVAMMIVVRLVDVRHFGGQTSTGEPATMRTWRRYVLQLVLIAGAVWALAHTLLPHVAP